ncbi:MAG: TRAP transporter substrate-binding protein DctP [Deltaproteobacteria bacterium]|nr:TRAP transporter substrate-binding protein DctP [Deltaproteobacteria bacterium]MBW2136139.1 TRAP transporter substrate-binding protein DctP [Deltaproteobacteria bacterium]
MKRFSAYALFFVFLAALCATLASPVLAGPKTLKAVSFLPKNHPLCAMIHVWVNRVNEQCKDAVKIDWVGGPEVIPGFDQAEALQNNTVQLIFNPAAYYAPLLPEGNAFQLSKLSMAEERKPGGFYDFMVERHKRIGMMFLGTWLYDPFYLRINRPVKKLDDLRGVKMRTAALYDRFMKKIGIIPVTVKFGETYTALERGLVDGFGWSTLGPADWGWLKYCKYIIDIPFYTRQNTLILMNLDVWNGLDKMTQQMIKDITVKFEPEMVAYFKKKIMEEWKRYDQMGIIRIKFSPEDTNRFLDAAYSAEWEDLEKKVPDLVRTLKRLTGN